MRKFSSAFLFACVALLTACDSHESLRDPAPSAEQKQYYADSLLATTPYGKPLEMDGCHVQLHRVSATHPGTIGKDFLTVATATCPTAVVKSSQESCGKGCVKEAVTVQKTALEPSGMQALRHKKSALKEELRKLQVAQARIAAQLEEIERTFPN